MGTRMCECARDSEDAPAQLPVAAKVPDVQSPGLVHVYPVEAVIVHVVPWATSVASDTQLASLHEATAAPAIVGTVQGLPARATETGAKGKRRNGRASKRREMGGRLLAGMDRLRAGIDDHRTATTACHQT